MKTVWVPMLMLVALLFSPVEAAEQQPITPPPFGAHNRWPIYNFTQYLYSEKYDIHVLATPGVSEWMMRESKNLVEKMVDALKNEEHRKQFAGHRNFLVTDADPSIPGSRLGHRNTGGNGFSMFNEAMACCISVDTLYPDKKPAKRTWGTPVHEFAHAVEITLGLQKRSDEIYKEHVRKYKPEVAREYFTWSVQRWFDSTRPGQTRDKMPKWEYDYIASVFDAGNTWKPKCTREGVVYELLKDDVKTAGEDDKPAPRAITQKDLRQVVGSYSTAHPKNDWHMGDISIAKRDHDGNILVLKWTNKAGRSWLLYPALKTGSLETGKNNPYHKKAKGKAFYIAFDESVPNEPVIAGFWFQGGLFIRTAEVNKAK